MFTDNQKREYMRMFFEGQPKEYYTAILKRMRLTQQSRAYLTYRYVFAQSDKQIARALSLSWFYVNKQINKALVESYDALKNLSYQDFETANQ